MVVFKYTLDNRQGYQEIVMPPSAKVVRVKLGPPTLQKGEPFPDTAAAVARLPRTTVYLWAIVDQSELPHLSLGRDLSASPPRMTRTFSIEMTGDDRPYIKPETYVGTYDDGPHVLHIFEVKRR